MAFKIATHPFFGKLTYIRVYSGKVDSGTQVINATKGKKERIGKLFQMHANKENPVDAASAGHIYAVIGLKDTTTGDTLSDPNKQVVLESMTFPDPVIEVAIEPKTKSDQEKLSLSIQKLAEEDPTFKVHQTRRPARPSSAAWASSTWTSWWTGCVASSRSRPTSASRRWPTGRPSSQGRQGRVHPQEADRWLGSVREDADLIEPFTGEDGATYEFENKVTGGRIPREYIPSVDPGAQDAMQYGVLAGYPLVDIKVTLLDGASHDVDSSEMAFKIAGSQALKKAAAQRNR